MATFSTPITRKAIKLAQDMGLTVTGFEVQPDGTVRVMTANEARDPADAALEHWMRSQNGKG